MRRHKNKTFKNKVCALSLASFGWLSVYIMDGDGTVFFIALIFAIPMFLSRENVFAS